MYYQRGRRYSGPETEIRPSWSPPQQWRRRALAYDTSSVPAGTWSTHRSSSSLNLPIHACRAAAERLSHPRRRRTDESAARLGAQQGRAKVDQRFLRERGNVGEHGVALGRGEAQLIVVAVALGYWQLAAFAKLADEVEKNARDGVELL